MLEFMVKMIVDDETTTFMWFLYENVYFYWICFVEHSSSHKPPWFELVHTFESHHSWKGCRWGTKYKFGLAGEAYQYKYIFENTCEERSLSVRHRPSTWVHRTRFCRWGIPAIFAKLTTAAIRHPLIPKGSTEPFTWDWFTKSEGKLSVETRW